MHAHYIILHITCMKTSGQSNLTKGRITATYGRFNCIHKMAPMYNPSNTCFR